MIRLLILVLLLVPASFFASDNVQTTTLTNINHDHASNQSSNNYLVNNSSYDTTLSFHEAYCPTGWWSTLRDPNNYFSIPNYYSVTSVNITFSLQFNRDIGWKTYSANFNSEMINALNQDLASGQTYFATENYAWQGQSGALLYWQFRLTIANSTYQWFDPNWGGWVAWTCVGGIKYNATIHIHNNWQAKTDQVHNLLNSYVNNHTLNLNSDFSASLLDYNNIKIENNALDNLLQQTLNNDYQTWKGYLQPYAYHDNPDYATLTFKFQDITRDYQQVVWTFQVKIVLHLTPVYWDKTLGSRLTINAGQLVDPNDPNGTMIPDKPLTWNNKQVYGTTANLVFNAAVDESETMKVNGNDVSVLNHKFTFAMTDKQDHTDDQGQLTNEYQIVLTKNDIAHYQIKYLIKQDTPVLSNQWFAWNPRQNQTQKALISPTLADGSTNLDYDREINPKTGTKTQIIWVKHQSENPFPLDPLNQKGETITDHHYDQGFLAEGSVSGMGVKQLFQDDWIKTVSRQTVNNDLIAMTNPINIKSDSSGHYWSAAGIYHYTITDQKATTAHKYVIIGAPYQNHYPRFLDVLNNQNTAVNFWSTIHGYHLKDFLVTCKQLNSTQIQTLTFENVMSYWKEYVSDLNRNAIPPTPHPINYLDLSKLNLDSIKMNLTTVDLLRHQIVFAIIKLLNHYQLVNNSDYEIKPLDDTSLQQLLQFKTVSDIQIATLMININSITTSTRAIGNTTIKIKNSPQYDPKHVIDLSNIKLQTWEYDFHNFTIDQIRKWIIDDIKINFINQGASNLIYDLDYHVSNLTDGILKDFLDNRKAIKTLVFTIRADDDHMQVQGSTTLMLINNAKATPAPSNPPTPEDPNPPIPLPNQSWFSNGNNLAWFLPLTIGSCGTILAISYYCYVKNKKGIGGKKVRNRKISKK